MGFGGAMTDTSAYNVEVWMNDDVKDQFYEAMWGDSGLGLNLGRVTLNSADYSTESFNYDDTPDDFALEDFDHDLSFDNLRGTWRASKAEPMSDTITRRFTPRLSLSALTLFFVNTQRQSFR